MLIFIWKYFFFSVIVRNSIELFQFSTLFYSRQCDLEHRRYPVSASHESVQGQLRSGGSGVCRHPVGPDYDEVRDRENYVGHALQRKGQPQCSNR